MSESHSKRRWKEEISFTTVCPWSYPGQVSYIPTERRLHSGYCNTEAPACFVFFLLVGLFSSFSFVLKGYSQRGWMDQTQVVHTDSLTSHHTKHLPSSLKNVTYLRRNYLFFTAFQIPFRCWLFTFISLHSAADWRWFTAVFNVFKERFLDLLTRKLA